MADEIPKVTQFNSHEYLALVNINYEDSNHGDYSLNVTTIQHGMTHNLILFERRKGNYLII